MGYKYLQGLQLFERVEVEYKNKRTVEIEKNKTKIVVRSAGKKLT